MSVNSILNLLNKFHKVMLTFSLHYACITQMTSRQNICTAMQYCFYGVAKSVGVCDLVIKNIEAHSIA
jgi:hypothetical protein